MTGASLRVAIHADRLTDRPTGIGRYASELLAGLRRAAPEHEYLEVGHDRASRVRIGWTQTVLPIRLRQARVDVCHATNYHAPLAWRGPLVVTIHDLSLLTFPETHPRRRTLLMAPLLRAAASRATAIITPSHASRDAAIRLLHVDPDRIHVVPEAPAAVFRPVNDDVRLAAVSARYGLRPGFVLAIGTLEPRKNLPALIDAWATLRAGGIDVELVLAGATGWCTDVLEARLARPDAADVRRLGYVPDEDLPALLTLAGVLAYPSLEEGFGLPVIEALACGTPTVTSVRGATAEVAGDAALLVDPADRSAIAAALALALSPGPVRERLREAGPRRAAGFSWDRAARATASIYGQVAGAPSGGAA